MPGFFLNDEDNFAPKHLPDGIKLIHGDAFALLPKMEDGEVDHIITDPPYSDQTHEGARTGRWSKGGQKPEVLVNFDSITPEQFLEFARHAVRVAKRWVISFCDWKYAHLLEDEGLLVRLGVWLKPAYAPQFTGDRPAQGWEAVAILHRKGKKRWNDGGKAAVWIYNKVNAEWHPSQKPIPLLRKMIQQFTDPGETILDPFMGSGSAAVACLQTGRKFVGIEKKDKYYREAQQRLLQRR